MTRDRSIQVMSGWAMLPLNLGMVFGGILMFFVGVTVAASANGAFGGFVCILSVLSGVAGLISLGGHFTLQPNEACVISLFGPYQGTVRDSGFF